MILLDLLFYSFVKENIQMAKGLPTQLFNQLTAVSSNLQDEIKRNAKLAVQSQLNRLNLIGREEFDIQSAVLTRSRQKISELEQQVEQLEKQLKTLMTETEK